MISRRVYTAARGVRLRNTQYELVLRHGEDFFFDIRGRSTYVTHTHDGKGPSFRLSKEQHQKLLERSSTSGKPKAGENQFSKLAKEVEHNIGLTRFPHAREILERIQQGALAPPGEHALSAPPTNFKTQKQRDKFFASAKGRIASGLKKNLTKILAHRSDQSNERIATKVDEHSVYVQAPIEYKHHAYAELRLSFIKSTTTGLLLTASVMTDQKVNDKERLNLYRTRVVRDFMTMFIGLKPKLSKSFGILVGPTVGPRRMVSNLHSKYLATEYYLLTYI